MPTTRQAHHPSGRVVSARMTEDTIARLDMLAARTGRSRGRYLRDAIEEMLPIYEKAYWGHAMKKRKRTSSPQSSERSFCAPSKSQKTSEN